MAIRLSLAGGEKERDYLIWRNRMIWNFCVTAQVEVNKMG